MTDAPDRLSNLSRDERVEAIKRSEEMDRAAIGEPGLESASGRDRAHGELPTSLGTNQGPADVSDVAPPEGSVKGTRVGERGDVTGAE